MDMRKGQLLFGVINIGCSDFRAETRPDLRSQIFGIRDIGKPQRSHMRDSIRLDQSNIHPVQRSAGHQADSVGIYGHFMHLFPCHPEQREGSLFSKPELFFNLRITGIEISMNHHYYIYMMTNKSHAVLYTGVTNNLSRRYYEHQNKLLEGFTKTYNVTKLVYFEYFTDITYAIAREKQIKGWKRAKKDALIEILNPEWRDLSSDL